MKYSLLDINILKVILSDKKKSIDFCTENKVDLFEENLWNFAMLVIKYVNTYKDLPTLNALQSKANNNVVLTNYLEDVWKCIESNTFDAKDYYIELEKLKERYVENVFHKTKDKLDNSDGNKLDLKKQKQNLEKALYDINSISKKKSYTAKNAKEYLFEFYDNYKAKLKDPNFDKGVPTGFNYLDYATDGLRPGELFLVGGETSSGKSVMLNSMAVQMWMQKNTINSKEFTQGYNVLYYSLEMPMKACYNRFLGKVGNLNIKKLRAAKLNSMEIDTLKTTMNFIKNYPCNFKIIDMARDATIQHIEKSYNDTKAEFEPDIVVIDYLGLMQYEGKESEIDHLKLGKIAEELHEFARVHNVIVLSAVQLNRVKPSKDSTNEENVGIHRIGRSSMILHNANICVQLLKRPNEQNFPTAEYHLIKNRDGELGKGTMRKAFNCRCFL